MSALDRLTAAHDLARDADHREVSMPVRTDDLALVEAMLAMVEAARGIDDYGWLPKNDYLALRAAIAAIEGSQGMSDYLTTSEQHRLACGTCGKRLRDHNEQSDHAFVRMTTLPRTPTPLDVERLARALPKVMTQEECDEVYAVGTNPLDVPYEWFTTPRELATDILSALEEPTR